MIAHKFRLVAVVANVLMFLVAGAKTRASESDDASKHAFKNVISAEGKIDKAKLPGLVLDDKDAKTTGDWEKTDEEKPLLGDSYLTDAGKAAGRRSVRFTPTLEKSGLYRITIISPPGKGRCNKTLVIVHGPPGDTQIDLNLAESKRTEPFVELGIIRLGKGNKNYVEITNRGADGAVVVDGIIFELVEGGAKRASRKP